MTIRPLHIFLSSPGDVSRERQLAIEVIDQIENEPAHLDRLKLEVVAWDKPGAGTPMPAHLEPQEAINERLKKPSECDIVIVVFWARMGTPLSVKHLKPDGNRYRSGTEYEFLDGFNAAKDSDKPEVLVYRRKKPPMFSPADPDRKEKLKQWDLVEEFFAEFRNPDGSYRSYYQEYDEPSDFKAFLEQNLRAFITQYLEPHPADKAKFSISIEEPTWVKSPFPGLRAFRPEEALIFYGRGREIDALIKKLSEPSCRFLAVVGASGTGKSSLVAAGVLPALGKDAIPGSKTWVCLRFTPGEVGDNPFMALASAFKPTIERHGQLPRDIAKDLEADPSKLKELLAMALGDKPKWSELLIVIDQFEEFFTLVKSKYQQDAFVGLLELAAKTERIRTVVTMRADFYHRCLEWPALDGLMAEGLCTLLAPKTGALHEMITRPAELAGLRFEEGLPERILDDTGMEPGALALMAFALFELWKKSKGSDGILTYAAYRSFNGVYGAIGKRAEDTFRDLERKKVVSEADLARVFRELVEVDERMEPTRRRTQQQQVSDGAAAETVVNALINARLLVTSKGEDQRPIVEVAHEAIFTNWSRLSRWIDDHADELRTCRSLARAAQEWKGAGSPSFKHLPDRAKLKQYRRVRPVCSLGEDADADAVERFLGAAQRRQRLWSGFLALVVLVVGILLVSIWLRSQEMNWNVLRIWTMAQFGFYDGPMMVQIPGGTFQMGYSDCDDNNAAKESKFECPRRRVAIQSFEIGQYEVTFDQYSAFVLATDGVEMPHDMTWGRASRPAIHLSWNDAKAYIGWLSRVTGKFYRLPTEAEWEYAARAGTKTAFSFGDDPGKLNEYGWYKDNSEKQTHPVGKKKPNAWGLYDMHGNVSELVEDDWFDNYEGAPDDGRVWVKDPRNDIRVARGGTYDYVARRIQSSRRFKRRPDTRSRRVGFRLARSVAPGP